MVCTATALAVLTTGVWTQEGIDSGALDQAAFGQSFGTFGEIFVAVCIFLFAVTTITVVVYYGEKNMQFVFRTRTAGLVWRCVIIAGMIFALFGQTSTHLRQRYEHSIHLFASVRAKNSSFTETDGFRRLFFSAMFWKKRSSARRRSASFSSSSSSSSS